MSVENKNHYEYSINRQTDVELWESKFIGNREE